jgi:hypothetical protein
MNFQKAHQLPSTAHDFLTDEGAYVHSHVEADCDDGDVENGPNGGGAPAFDLYEGESHDIIMQDGLIVDMGLIDWDSVRFYEGMN